MFGEILFDIWKNNSKTKYYHEIQIKDDLFYYQWLGQDIWTYIDVNEMCS